MQNLHDTKLLRLNLVMIFFNFCFDTENVIYQNYKLIKIISINTRQLELPKNLKMNILRGSIFRSQTHKWVVSVVKRTKRYISRWLLITYYLSFDKFTHIYNVLDHTQTPHLSLTNAGYLHHTSHPPSCSLTFSKLSWHCPHVHEYGSVPWIMHNLPVTIQSLPITLTQKLPTS